MLTYEQRYIEDCMVAGGYHTEPKTHRSRPDLCFPIAYLTAYAATILALLYAVYYKMQVSLISVMKMNVYKLSLQCLLGKLGLNAISESS